MTIMAQVSRLPLPKALALQMQQLFYNSLAELTTEEDVADFLNDLLTPTEKIMLQKRLAIAFLLQKGYDQRTIHRIMKVSVTTVNSVNFWLKNQGKGYRNIMERMRKEQRFATYLEKFDSLLRQFSTLGKSIYPSSPKETRPHDSIL